MSRHVGLSLPLFSIRSSESWGIGEIGDLPRLTSWLARGGFSRVMVLPLGTLPAGETSPYSATSTLSIDPIYISVRDVRDFTHAGGERALSARARAALAAARDAPAVDYDAVRTAKHEALALAFDAFLRREWRRKTGRAAALAAYAEREHAWLDDYALFQALSSAHGQASWREWPAALRDRDPAALDRARRELADDLLRHQYWQWIAETQWQRGREAARAAGVAVYGDLPFVANLQSPEVWARAGEYLLDVSAGVPPDAFSETGQDWGLPTYRWDAIAASGYAWTFQRGRRMAALYDGLRVDHVIGIYRTYGRPPGGVPFFSPEGEAAQVAQGEAVLRALQQSGLALIAEDLGVVPDFLRPSLARLGIPGCKVIRWERDWHADGQPFVDPATYPPVSAAMTGTHDTEPLPLWWATAPLEERRAMLALPLLAASGLTDPECRWSEALRDRLIELAYRAGSNEVFLPVQDFFGWPGRINTPGTVGPENWRWCLPWFVDRVNDVDDAVERARFGRALAEATGRLPASDYTNPPKSQDVTSEG
ncbi:MAG: 4-alpha-glucanotransferase [Acidobacteria bacterium]|nr:4-alpha-glucanotransferase [Acidobacteriota bacterium]